MPAALEIRQRPLQVEGQTMLTTVQLRYELNLNNLYVEIYKIPTAQQRKLQIKHPKIFPNYQQWINALIRDSKLFSKTQIVLLIFKTIKQAKGFIANFSQKQSYRIIQLYDHDKYFSSMKNSFDQLRTIIVSTNLGGRGTDIQIKNKKILTNGGLYVMMTYFADNWRIQEQVIGRAGRNGQPGSGAFYINIDNEDLSERMRDLEKNQKFCNLYLSKLVQARKQKENQLFESSKIVIKNEEIKKSLLDQFYCKYLNESYKRLMHLESKQKCKQEKIQYYLRLMQCQIAQQQWGIFLKRKISQKDNKEKVISVDFKEFQQQYEFNRQNHNVNPGFYAICGSQLISIDENESQKLFDQAIVHNENNWVCRYYRIYFTIKKHFDKYITRSAAEQINKQLKQICQIIIVQYALSKAIQQNSKRQSNENVKNINPTQASLYINIMTSLQTIGQSLHKYVVEENSKIKISCKLKSITGLAKIKGLKHIIYDFRMLKKQQDFQFVELINNTFKSVFLTAFSAVGTIFAVASTPIITICGGVGDLKSLWQKAGRLWINSYENWKVTISRMPPISAIAFFLLTRITIGIPSIIVWLFFHSQGILKQVESMPPLPEDSEISKLIQITGIYRMTEDALKKMEALRLKLQEKRRSVQDQFNVYINHISQFKANQVSQPDLINLFRTVFGQQYHQSLKKTTLSIIEEKKIAQRAQSQIDKLIKEQDQNSYEQDIINQIFDNLKLQIQQNILEERASLKYNSQKHVAFARKYQKENEKLRNLMDIIKHKDLCMSQKIGQAIKINFSYIKQDSLTQQLQKLNDSQKKIIENNKQRVQLFTFCDKTILIENMVTNNSKESALTNQKSKEFYEEIIFQLGEKMQNHLQKKKKSQIRKLYDQYEKDEQAIQIQILTQTEKNIQQHKTTPATNMNQINKPFYYEFVLKQKCSMNNIQFRAATSPLDVKAYLKAQGIQEKNALILCGKIAIYKNQDIIIKCYQKQSQKMMRDIISILGQQKINKCANFNYLSEKQLGNYLISDLQKFIEEQKFDQEDSNLYPQKQIKKQYIKALLIQKNIQRCDYIIKEKRQSKQSSLPMCFFPFQYHIKSKDLKDYCYKLVDQICKILYKQKEDYKLIQQLVQSAKDQLLEEQTKLILQEYPQMKEYVCTKKASKRAK